MWMEFSSSFDCIACAAGYSKDYKNNLINWQRETIGRHTLQNVVVKVSFALSLREAID